MRAKSVDAFIKGYRKHDYKLDQAPRGFFKNKEFVKSILPYDLKGEIYRYLPKDLKKDREFIKEIVSINGNIFMHETKLHADKELNLLAIKSCIDTAQFLNLNGKDGFDIAKYVVSLNGLAFQFLPKFQDNDEIIRTALTENGIAYKFMTPAQRGNPEYATLAVQNYPFMYTYTCGEAREDVSVALTAMTADRGYASYIYQRLLQGEVKADLQISSIACEKNIQNILHVPTQTFEQADFQANLNAIIKAQKNEYIENEDQQGLFEFQMQVKDLLGKKDEMIAAEKLEQSVLENHAQNFSNLVSVHSEDLEE